jgi:hypothetical protein
VADPVRDEPITLPDEDVIDPEPADDYPDEFPGPDDEDGVVVTDDDGDC